MSSPTVETLPVTLVIPVRNRPVELRAAIRSAQNQGSCAVAEIIVVDDASDDSTAAVAEALGARVIRLPERKGAGGARNAGVRAAACEWVAFLDADDAWHTGHLQQVWASRGDHALVADCGVGTLSNRIYGSRHRQPLRLERPEQVIFPSNCVQPSGVLVRRDILLQVGGFPDEGLCEDMDAWIRILQVSTGLLLPGIGWSYGEHAGQTSGDRQGMQAYELEVVNRYALQAWFHPDLVRSILVRHHWERLTVALHSGDRTKGLREAWWLLRRPASLPALVSLLRTRSRLRSHQIRVTEAQTTTP